MIKTLIYGKGEDKSTAKNSSGFFKPVSPFLCDIVKLLEYAIPIPVLVKGYINAILQIKSSQLMLNSPTVHKPH